MYKRFIVMICAVSVICGCAGKSKFIYEPLPASARNCKGNHVALLAPIVDHRSGVSEIDKSYDGDLIKDMQIILRNELMNTCLFDRIVTESETDKYNKPYLRIEPVLKKLDWKVPEYESLVAKAFIISLLTGGIGGMIYGSTDTDVHGETTIHILVTDRADGSTLLDKSFSGHYEERMTKFKCDTATTKVSVASKSFTKTIELIKTDLKSTLGQAKQEVVSSSP